jgi:1,2-diacylglycerol 3-beta-glucosyltransferase
MSDRPWPENQPDPTGEGISPFSPGGLESEVLESVEEIQQDLSQLFLGDDQVCQPIDFQQEQANGRFSKGRRQKAAIVLLMLWGTVIALHLIPGGFWFVMAFTGLLSIQAVRMLLASPSTLSGNLAITPNNQSNNQWPFVSLLIAAKNEEVVITHLVENICQLDYPADRYEVWVVDDHSTDRTPAILGELSTKYPQLKVLRRDENASGGKSGALNQVLPFTQGEFIGVFDADAQITQDLLKRVLPCFQPAKVGAVQVRKAIANQSVNFWTKGQAVEMALDSAFQQQRIAIGGIGELRGNGQFMRRQALENCGGWNEETITDDLDLTVRLHLNQWDIDFVLMPAVWEEGVTKMVSLWHQRNRWAEGGYQRYLDYWDLIIGNRLGVNKTIDLLGFFFIQYLLPTAAIPDYLMGIILHKLPLTTPLTIFGFFLSSIGFWLGLRRTQETSFLTKVIETMRGSIYMGHWLVVMGFTTTRMAFLPKRLKWVKTVHTGMNS